MLILAIDDEARMLHMLQEAISEAAPQATVRGFSNGRLAIDAIEREKLQPDFIFSDIMMPELNGLELAVRLKTAAPSAKLIFVTGYSDYALSAYQLHASGYIVKPVEPERIREELENHTTASRAADAEGKLLVHCFGAFEVFWMGKPLSFGRQQTKELFAWLVDRRGAYGSAEEIIAALWEDEGNLSAAKHRLRNLVSDLRKTLSDVGQESLLLRRRNQLAIQPEMLACDYYRMLDGDMDATNTFYGEYMAQYSWAELTKGALIFRNGFYD